MTLIACGALSDRKTCGVPCGSIFSAAGCLQVLAILVLIISSFGKPAACYGSQAVQLLHPRPYYQTLSVPAGNSSSMQYVAPLQRVVWPPLSSQKSWADENTRQWLVLVRNPPRSLTTEFSLWLYDCFVKCDIPSLYAVSLELMAALVPPGAKGPKTSESIAVWFASVQSSLALCRLRAAYVKGPWPRWFPVVWKAVPASRRLLITQPSYPEFLQVLNLTQDASAGAVVYMIFSHAGLYIGKANCSRRIPGGSRLRCGVASRFTEHLGGTMFPSSRAGVLPRYGILRRSVGSLSMLPLAYFETETRALAVERALIQSLRPVCNGADWALVLQKKKLGTRLQVKKAFRRRPPQHLRVPKAVHVPVWDQRHFAKHLSSSIKSTSEAVLDPWPKLPFSALYREKQNQRMVQFGVLGPLPLYGPEFFPLFIALCATRNPRIAIPYGWQPWQVARQVFQAAEFIDARLRCLGMRIAARRACEFLLRRFKLPPLTLRPLPIPAPLVSSIPQLRRIIGGGLSKVQNFFARQWLVNNLRVIPGPRLKWANHVNSKVALAGIDFVQLAALSPDELAKLISMPSLHAQSGPWRLPQWPCVSGLRRATLAGWKDWAIRHRLPRGVRCDVYGGLLSFFQQLVVSPAPLPWADAENVMGTLVRSSPCRMLDDKVSQKLWAASTPEVAAALVAGIAQDPGWVVHNSLEPDTVKSIGYSR